MNICEKKEEGQFQKPFVAGRLYKWREVYLATPEGKLVNLSSGIVYDRIVANGCTDVTDKYCLKEI